MDHALQSGSIGKMLLKAVSAQFASRGILNGELF